jgi:NitT/TauT family transport system substrate-binding protein
MIRSLTTIALVLSGLILAPAVARADDTLTIVTGAQPTAFFEVFNNVALNAGFYKEEHLTVTTQYAGNPTIAAQLIASGKGDIGGMSIEPIILGYEKGLRLEAFFVRDPLYDFVVGVLDDSPIRTLADFKGTSLGEYSVGSSAELSTNAMLAGAGVKSSEISYLPIGNGSQAIQALTTKKVAGAAFPYPELANYELAAHIKFRYFVNPILKDIGNTAYAASPATIANKADLLKRFCRATAKAAILIRVNPRVAARYFLEGAGIKVTDEMVDNEVKLLELAGDQLAGANPASAKIGLIPPRGIDVYAKFLADQGVTKTATPASAIVTDQFIAYANDFDHKAFIAQMKALR